ncbi:SDR family NAD(P)-dependent oxidoreductase [Lentzea flaviverrucosa]|uniref:NAD(P)-dependent dehydrogenase, short-chain alcohol dehydrogenase family n=1 Tax=Lentzea flaviverrucosa TaxID=200379 RepID=A0A1H9X0P4_9PSEU|nr:SDR family oxidoreductase [Lentzea flaviverrucosa]RDI21040.1 NAD(P)-dependent dehydrogenase (short-subunit alcohol dehydrogenase family) [Lentzea flaviverrucosa]SES39233.1 NAD(P)-dependent dehydrogenase, short-chain alcohol dehydrogenase family [Lentzea flaviverrucosa]
MTVLAGKAVVITGAGQGLGRAFAVHAAAAGAAVVVNDVDEPFAGQVAGLITSRGGKAVVSAGPVQDPDQAEAMVDACTAAFGRIDGLVNNAGIRYQAEIGQDDPRAMRELIEINVLGTLYCTNAAVRSMGRGSIVNLGSVAMVGQPTALTYSASKGAVASITAGAAAELRDKGIRVNAVCPVAWTRMAAADTKGGPSGPPETIAPLVTYLLSDRAAKITGQLVRFAGQKLHVMGQTSPKEPVLEREAWDVDSIAEAFERHIVPEEPARVRWGVGR